MSHDFISRRNLDFVLFEWLRVADLPVRSRFAEHSHDTFTAALDTYETIATEYFGPHNRANDVHEPQLSGNVVHVNPAIGPALKAFADAGLMAATHDYDLGGMQLPYTVERAGMMFLFAANIATAAYPMLTMANAALLLAYADATLVQQYLPDMLAGRTFGTMCLSEPQAGSSLGDITTRAVLQSDGRYRLTGNKMWISAGDHDLAENIVHLVLAKIPSPAGALVPGTSSISLFLVPKFLPTSSGAAGERNDVVVAGLNHKLGYRGTSNCSLNFGEGAFRPEGLAGALAQRIGPEGGGLHCMFHMMNEARIAVGAGAAALGSAGYLASLDYARERRQGRPIRAGGKRDAQTPPVAIIEHTDVRRMLMAQKAYVEGAIALVLYCARLVDEVATAPAVARDAAKALLELLTPVAKSWPSTWCLAANDLAIQIHGGYGYSRDFPLEQYWRDNRLNAIHEGTHGIQAGDLLGRKIAANEGEAFTNLSLRIDAALGRASGVASLAESAAALAAVWARLREVTARLVDAPIALRLANAASYLDAFGHVVVGWLCLEQAETASRALAASRRPDAGFYSGKLQTFHWFVRWELPRVAGWLAVLDPIDTTVLDMLIDWF